MCLDESGTGVAESYRNVANGRKVASAISSFVNGRGLQLEFMKALLIPILFFGSETMI